MMRPDRPNTNVENSLLSERMVICCGEDAAELLQALRTEFPRQETAYHEYRCYRFWKFAEFTLIWTGIGTGCLEPLLFELFVCCRFVIRELCKRDLQEKYSGKYSEKLRLIYCCPCPEKKQ